MRRTIERGFTIVELLVTLGVASIVLALIYQIFIAQQRGYSVQEEVAEAQQSGRIAADEIARELRNLGYGVPRPGNQPMLLECRPFELLYNADLDEGATRPEIAANRAIDSLVSPGTTLYTAPAALFGSNAETVLLSLKDDGNLVRKVFWDATDEEEATVAVNLGKTDRLGNAVPLFLYWGYFDADDALDLWGDDNPEDGVLDAAEIAALTPVIPPGGHTLDDTVRRVEIQVLAETRSADRFYAYNAGVRQGVIRSNVTPRNLSTCPMIDAATPNSTITSLDAGGTSTYTFSVQYRGQPEDGRRVYFTLTKPPAPPGSGGDSSQIVPPPFGATNAAGEVQVTVQWEGCAYYKWLADHGLPLPVYTLTATIGQPPPLNTALGNCDPDSASMEISFGPGAADSVEVYDLGTAERTTCGAENSFTFKAKALDVCGIVVPPGDRLYFEAPLTNGANRGLVDGGNSAAFMNNGQQFTVTVPTAGAWGAPDGAGRFHLQVQPDAVASTWTPTTILPSPIPTVPVAAWPPASLAWTPALTLGPHQDCPTPDQTDFFQALDCFANTIYDDLDWSAHSESGYQVAATLTKDPSALAPQGDGQQGTIFRASGVTSPTSIDITQRLSGSLTDFDVGYTPPTCTLDPSRIQTAHPEIQLALTGPTATTSPPSGPPMTLGTCLDTCVIEASIDGGVTWQSPLSITNCETPANVKIRISSCQLDGKDVELVLSSTGGTQAEFVGGSSPTHKTVTLGGNVPSEGVADLTITSAPSGSQFTVTAYYPSQAGALWSCGGQPLITVENLCRDIGIYADDTYSQDLLTGGSDCLSGLREFFFEVEDCRFTTAPVNAQTPDRGLWVTVVLDDGTVYDREFVDLDPVIPPSGSPQKLRSRGGVGLQLIRDDAGPYITQNGFLSYPSGKSVTLLAQYTDPNDPADNPSRNDCDKRLRLTAPVPVCFPNAITSGGGAGWNGNFKVHWGDVVVRGNVSLPSKFIAKSSGGQFNGASFGGTPAQTDRFADIYVGKAFPGDTATGNFIGLPNPTPGVFDQPFIGAGYGNYFRNISYDKITEMIVLIDYETLKFLAQERGVYWYTLPGGDIRNPTTGQTASLQTVLKLPGPGLENAYHDGDFIFVDTYGTATTPPNVTGGQIDAAAAAGTLPVHPIAGDFFTEGIIYVAGSIDFGGLGPTTKITADTPPELEAHYNHNIPGWIASEDQLPIRSDPNKDPGRFDVGVHINGAVYVDGVITGSGNPSVFGSVTAELGYTGTGTPEIWYNYNLNVSGLNQSLCVDCCIMRASPSTATLVRGEDVQLTAVNPSGVVDWTIQSMTPRVAGQTVATLTVNSTGGLVTAQNPGTITIRIRDRNNCTAFATIFVQEPCERFSQWDNLTPRWASVTPGGSQRYDVGYSPSGTVNWTIQSWPSSGCTLLSSGNDWVEVMANCPGTWVDIMAEDPACPDPLWAGMWVEWPANWQCTMSLAQKPATVQFGTTFDFEALNSTCGEVWWGAWSTDGGTYGILTPDAADPTRASFQATAATPPGTTVTVNASDSGGCWDTASFTVGACPTLSIAQNPSGNPLFVGTTYTLTATGGAEDYAWLVDTAAGTANGTLTPSAAPDTETATFKPTTSGNLVLRVTDAAGCSGELRSFVTCQSPTVTVPSPAANATYGTLTANGPSMVVQGIPDDRNGADPLNDIARVEFVITRNATGAVVHSLSVPAAPYCGFGGADCALSPGDLSSWADGDYTLRVTAYTRSTHPCGPTSVSQWIPFRVYNTACPLDVDPPSPRAVRKNDSVILTATNPVGVVEWTSLDTSLATVSPATGNTTRLSAANAPGRTVSIRVEDDRCFQSYRVNIIP